MSVHKKLMAARIDLQCSSLKKSGHNKFAGYQYFELGDFLPTAQKIFAEHGLCGVISFGTEKATLTITDCEDNSQIVIESPMSTAALKGCHEVQNLGAVQTYIRRYLWVAALEIVEHDAIDASTGNDSRSKIGNIASAKTPLAGALDAFNPEQIEKLKEIASEVVTFAEAGNWDDAFATYDNISDNEERVAVWSILGPHSGIRSQIKKIGEQKRKAA